MTSSMHGQNSKENQDKLISYYNEYVGRQKRIGVNLRHKSIAQKLIDNNLVDGINLLEIGCGIGTFSGLLTKINGKGKNLCLDISDQSIKFASATYANEDSLIFQCANAVTYDFGEQVFKVIVLPDVIEHIPLEFHAELFKKLSDVLTEDGFILIHIPNPYYLAWCHENRPDLLQIIDQPVYTSELLNNLNQTDLFLHALNTYSIWVDDCDYQAIILRKKNYQNFEKATEEKITFWDKVKYKLNARKK